MNKYKYEELKYQINVLNLSNFLRIDKKYVIWNKMLEIRKISPGYFLSCFDSQISFFLFFISGHGS